MYLNHCLPRSNCMDCVSEYFTIYKMKIANAHVFQKKLIWVLLYQKEFNFELYSKFVMRTTMILTWTVGHSYKEETEGTRGVLLSNKPNLNIYIYIYANIMIWSTEHLMFRSLKKLFELKLDTAHKYIGRYHHQSI